MAVSAKYDEFNHWWATEGDWVEEPNYRRNGMSGVQCVERNGKKLYVKRMTHHLFHSVRYPFGRPTIVREVAVIKDWMSDKVFRGNRGATGVFFMTLVTIATIVYWMNPAGNPTVDMICMIVIGFLIYGPVMLIGLHALELAPKKAAGTAAGFTGLFGYLGGSVAASAIVGYTVDFFGWDGGFMVMIGGSILAVILLIVVMIGEKRRHEQLLQKRNGG